MAERVVLITGGARRIGEAISREFHGAGYNLLLHCNHSTVEAERLAEDLCAKRADSVHVLQQDLSESGALAGFVDTAAERFGHLDILVNNASVFEPSSVDELTTEIFDRDIDVNLKAPLFLAKHAAPYLKIRDGCIVNITDIHAEKPLRNYVSYSIAKAGLAMATRVLALELAPDIRVNAVAPGPILWPEGDATMDEKAQAAMLDALPMGRIGAPAEIARAVRFLAEQSNYITGQILSVDGGALLT